MLPIRLKAFALFSVIGRAISERIPRFSGVVRFIFLYVGIPCVFIGCGATKYLDNTTILYTDGIGDTATVRQSQVPILAKVPEVGAYKVNLVDSLQFYIPNTFLEPGRPTSSQLVLNYLKSDNKKPGGHCLTASKSRFLQAYEDVYGHSVYKDLPDSIATDHYTPAQVFDHLYASTSGKHRGWLTLPKEYRGRGSAGALAHAGMGKLVGTKGVWNGDLKFGAPMQVWRHKADFQEVVRGISDPKIDPFGHSFIFLSYVRNEKLEIVGLKIADQGYQSQRTLVPMDYEVWWGVNLSI